MLPHLLALDLDYTACDRTRHLGRRTREALTAARAAGHIVCFATGRRDIDMHAFWPESTYADYLLLNNGGKLLHAADRAVLFNRLIDPPAARALIEHCLARNYQLHVVSGTFWAVNRWNDGLNEYVEQLGVRPVLYSTLEETPYDQVEGFMATQDLAGVCEAVKALRLPLSCTPAEDQCVDIMALGISKWDGLRRLAEGLDIPGADHCRRGLQQRPGDDPQCRHRRGGGQRSAGGAGRRRLCDGAHLRPGRRGGDYPAVPAVRDPAARRGLWICGTALLTAGQKSQKYPVYRGTYRRSRRPFRMQGRGLSPLNLTA